MGLTLRVIQARGTATLHSPPVSTMFFMHDKRSGQQGILIDVPCMDYNKNILSMHGKHHGYLVDN